MIYIKVEGKDVRDLHKELKKLTQEFDEILAARVAYKVEVFVKMQSPRSLS